LGVCCRHEVGICNAIAEAATPAGAVVDASAEALKIAVDPIDTAQIVLREGEAVLFHEMIFDRTQILRVEFIAGRCVCDYIENLLYRGMRSDIGGLLPCEQT
jgi:hypothetical protein